MHQILKVSKYLSILMLVIFISAVITYIINPNFSDTLNSVSHRIPSAVSRESGLKLVIAYIVNNGFKVPIGMLILAIIPIRFLYWVYPILTAIFPGIAYGIIFRFSLIKGGIILISSLPHMLVELLAFCFWLIALDRLNHWIRDKMYKKKTVNLKFVYELKQLASYYFKFFIPLIVLAAFFETYVADWIEALLS